MTQDITKHDLAWPLRADIMALVERLRGAEEEGYHFSGYENEAADTITALQADVERLMEERRDACIALVGVRDTAMSEAARAEAAERRVEELREALKPFVEIADALRRLEQDQTSEEVMTSCGIAAFFHARAAYKGEGNG